MFTDSNSPGGRGAWGQLTNVYVDIVTYGIIAQTTSSSGWPITINNFYASGIGGAAVAMIPGGSYPPRLHINGGALNWFSSVKVVNDAGDLRMRNIANLYEEGEVFTGAPAVPATGVAVTNTTGFPVQIFVSSGTVSSVIIDGQDTGLNSGAFQLQPDHSIALNYLVAPVWKWLPQL